MTSRIKQDVIEPTNIKLKFICGIAESFNHTYKLIFFKNGVKVSEEDLLINVTVE